HCPRRSGSVRRRRRPGPGRRPCGGSARRRRRHAAGARWDDGTHDERPDGRARDRSPGRRRGTARAGRRREGRRAGRASPEPALEPRTEADGSPAGHDAVLFFRPRAERDAEEFYADARYGELWVGVRPTLAEIAAVTGVDARHLDELADALRKDVGEGGVAV